MAVELEHFCFTTQGLSQMEGVTLEPESFRGVSLFAVPIKVLVFCGVDNAVSVFINAQNQSIPEHLQAVVYENDKDDHGRKIELAHGAMIPITGPQILSISLLKPDEQLGEELIIFSKPY